MSRVTMILLALLFACGGEPAASAPAPKKAPKRATSPAATDTAAHTEVGDMMPPYSASYLDGKPFDLAAEKGNVVFVNVWATWCGPCRMEIPELKVLHEKYHGRGFKVIGVSVDETGPDAVKQFVQEKKIGYPIAIDPDGKLANILQTNVLPTSIIVDGSGRIVWRQVGALMPNEVAAVDEVIQKTLGLKKAKT